MAKEIMEGLIKTDKGIVKIIGHDGATFVPHVTEDLMMSWTNDKGLKNPPPVKLPAGNVDIDKTLTKSGAAADAKAVGDEIRKIPRKATPQMYGAKGDGETDDTAAFKAALAEERVVFVPGGTYKLSSGIVIGDNCMLELSQDTVLEFTNTTGYCINLGMSSNLKGNHATIKVPYWFEGNVLYSYTNDQTSADINAVPPWTKWDPQWKSGRYVTDINICKADSRGFHYCVNPGECKGTAVYISADNTAGLSTYMWGVHYSGIRIAGAFTYGIHAKNIDDGWTNDMRIQDVLIDACEIGVCIEDCSNVYVSAIVQPRRAYTTGNVYKPYAKHGFKMIRSQNIDLTGSRVWDWENEDKPSTSENEKMTLWTDGGEYQHIALIGDCRNLILDDFAYYLHGDTRKRIYTDFDSNLDFIKIIQEPITRWFRMKDAQPYFSDGTYDHLLITKERLADHFVTDYIKSFTDVLPTAIDTDGSIYNGIGYKRNAATPANGGAPVDNAYYITTGFIPCRKGQKIYTNAISMRTGWDDGRIIIYDKDFNYITHVNRGLLIKNASYYAKYAETENGCTFTVENVGEFGLTMAEPAYIRLNIHKDDWGENPMIAVDEDVKYTIEGFLNKNIRVYGESIIGAPGQITPDWVATKEEVGGDTIIIPEQTITYGMWSQLQVYINAGTTYDVYINGTVYACTAYNHDGGIVLGNYTIAQSGADVPHNNEPFYIYWAGGSAASGMFDINSTLIYPVTLKVTDHVQTVYNKMPEGYLPDNVVKSVNGKTGAVTVDVPTKTSQLTNDSGYITIAVATLLNYYLKTETYAKTETYSQTEIDNLISGLDKRLNAIADSEDVDLDQLSEIVAYIKSNKSLIDYITTNKVSVADIVNNLTTADAKKPLSAAQGKALKTLYDSLPSWAKASTKPSYIKSEVGLGNVDNVKQYSASNPPPYPVTSVNGKTGAVQLGADDVGAASKEQFAQVSEAIADEVTDRENAIADIKAQGVQQTPLYAESEELLETNGDTTKVYVLPDGYIYAHKIVTETVKAYENLAKNFQTGRYNSSGVVDSSTTEATACLDYIGALKNGDIIRIKGFGAGTDYNAQWSNASKVNVSSAKLSNTSTYYSYSYDSATGIITLQKTSDAAAYSYFRISGVLAGTIDDVIITLNEEIKEETATVQKWINTGHAFVPANYEDKIIELEEDVLTLQSKVETMGGTSSETVAIPIYWGKMVTEKTDTVKTLQTVGGKNCVSFAWASDTHIPDNDSGRTNDIGKVIAKMLDNCEIPFAVLSGDINTRASYSTEETFVDAQASMPVHLAPLWGTDRLLMALGNHDGCYGDSTGYYRKQLAPERMWQIFFRGQALDFRRVFSDDGLYFYVDNISQKTRFIVLNSHFGGKYAEDENGWAVNNRFGTSCYGQAQLDWLADVALDMPDGYGAIITAHVPPNITYTVDKEQFIGIVNAYCNKTTYSGSFSGVDGWTSNSVSVDFTGAKGEIIAMFAGHVHGDSIDTTTLACPLLTILSAGASANEPYKDDAPTRTAGTDTETSFDVVTINRATRTIYCTRVGAGSDREISY